MGRAFGQRVFLYLWYFDLYRLIPRFIGEIDLLKGMISALIEIIFNYCGDPIWCIIVYFENSI